MFRLSEKRVIQGLPVGVLWASEDEFQLIFRKMAEAFDLLARYDPRRLTRFRNDVSGVLVGLTSGGLAEWLSPPRLVRLQSDYIQASETSELEIASTLIHEGAHAWLDRLGFDYEEERRARVETLCFRSQLAFLRRIPGAEPFMAAIEQELVRDPRYWTDAAFRDRQVAHLRGLGAPEWLTAILVRIRRRPSNQGLHPTGVLDFAPSARRSPDSPVG